MARIEENLTKIRHRIHLCAARCGRSAEEIRMLAVSKTFPAEAVRVAHAAGQRCFGENRVQEAAGKIEALADLDLEWHLIGHLQRNKARRAVELFDVIQTLDSQRLIHRVARVAEELDRRLEVFIQVNIADEQQKSGATPADLPGLVEQIESASHLQLRGLMAIPPLSDDPGQTRTWFRRLRRLRDALSRSLELSMGMTGDFETAIEEGSTLLRVGTAIFGPRGR